MKIDWSKHAKVFLKAHNWKEIEKGLWSNKIFPLMEDLSAKFLLIGFVQSFYKESWTTYKSLIEWANSDEYERRNSKQESKNG